MHACGDLPRTVSQPSLVLIAQAVGEALFLLEPEQT